MCLLQKKIICCLIIVAASIKISESARILGIIPTPSFSHQVVLQPLWKELSLRGHQVTVMTTNPINNKELTNLTEIDLSFSYKTLNDGLEKIVNAGIIESLNAMVSTHNEINNQQLQHPKVRKIINNSQEHFDLVITEYTMIIMHAFGKRFNCPVIGVVAADAPNVAYEQFGNPVHPVLFPDIVTDISENSSLLSRVVNVLHKSVLSEFVKWKFLPAIQDSLHSHFGTDYVISDILEHTSLLFVNSNPLLHYVRPVVPKIVYIGGHVERASVKTLDTELKAVLDNAVDGFIYFSLGGNVKSKDLSQKTLKVIFDTFTELPYMILWKYELKTLENKPKNVIISTWLPQQEVLEHPNLKLFITHGGGLSMQEAVSAEVPMVAMPFFTDQPRNTQRMVKKGIALSVDHRNLETESFKNTILEVINNPKYKANIVQLSKWYKDEPMTGLEKAVWWTEYVIRHNGTKHLISPVLDMPWYQYYFVDVLGVITLTLITVSYLTIIFVKTIAFIIKYLILSTLKIKKN